MTKQEFSVWAVALRTYFPSEKLLPNLKSMELWYEELKDLSYEDATISLRNYVQTNHFPPGIADIRSGAISIHMEESDWGENWSEALFLVRRFGIYRKEEALSAASKRTKEVLNRLGWENFCQSENIVAERANFRKIYEDIEDHNRNKKVLTKDVLDALSTEKVEKSNLITMQEKTLMKVKQEVNNAINSYLNPAKMIGKEN